MQYITCLILVLTIVCSSTKLADFSTAFNQFMHEIDVVANEEGEKLSENSVLKTIKKKDIGF